MKETGHGITYHGGFKVGDIVEAKLPDRYWSDAIYEITKFNGLQVELKCTYCELYGGHCEGHYELTSISNIRHPHLVKERK